MAITGFALTPVTAGVSLGLSIAGIGVAMAGGATAVGASIADTVIERHNIKGIQKRLDEDFKKLRELNAMAEELNRMVEESEGKCFKLKKLEVAGLLAMSLFKTTEFGVMGGLRIGMAVARGASIAARAISLVAIGASALLIPIDLLEIARSIHSMAKDKNRTKSVQQLEDFIKDLKEQKDKIVTMENNL